MDRNLWKGNEAVAEAALRAGMDFFAGYPITPSSEALEYLSDKMPGMGRTFIQAENETSAIHMVIGAAACGARCLTASSGPGVSLKASGISYAAETEVPFVLLNVQRWGTGLGYLDSGQSDYMRDVKGGGHGDYRQLVLAPNSVQELVDMTLLAFELAERYRIGVTILSEALLGQMVESVEMPPFQERSAAPAWCIDGTGKHGLVRMKKTDEWYQPKQYRQIEEIEPRFEQIGVEDADIVLVAFGLPARVCAAALEKLRGEGCRAGLIRPQTLWPFPHKAFKGLEHVKAFLTIETNQLGMMVEDVALAARRQDLAAPVYCYACGSGLPKAGGIAGKCRDVLSGREERWY